LTPFTWLLWFAATNNAARALHERADAGVMALAGAAWLVPAGGAILLCIDVAINDSLESETDQRSC
jgi:hypothetical protein